MILVGAHGCIFLRSKEFSYFHKFKTIVEKESGCYLKVLHSYIEHEFTSNEFNKFCKVNGVKK